MTTVAEKMKTNKCRISIIQIALTLMCMLCFGGVRAHDVGFNISTFTFDFRSLGAESTEPYFLPTDSSAPPDFWLEQGESLVHKYIIDRGLGSGCLSVQEGGYSSSDVYPWQLSGSRSATQEVVLRYVHRCVNGLTYPNEIHEGRNLRRVECIPEFHELEITGIEATDVQCVHVNQRPTYSGSPQRYEVFEGDFLLTDGFSGTVFDPDNYPRPLQYTQSGLENFSGPYSFSPFNGRITYQPDFTVSSQESNEEFIIEVVAEDGDLEVQPPIAPITIVVRNVNRPPTLSGNAPSAILLNQAFSFSIIGRDPDNELLSFSLSGAPAWMTLSSSGNTATISGTPNATGTFNVTLTARDGTGAQRLSDTFAFSLRVSVPNVAPTARFEAVAALAPEAAGPNTIQVGANELVTFDGTYSADPDPNTTLSYSWFVNGVQAGANLGTLSQRFTAPGTYDVSLIVNDGQLDSDEFQISVDVLPYDRGLNLGALQCGNENGSNPINHGTGNKFQAEIDYVGTGTNPLAFARYYNSKPMAPGVLGEHWRHTYERTVKRDTQANVAQVFRDTGTVVEFQPPASGSLWRAPAGVTERLEEVAGTGWKYTTNDDTVELYDTAGQLLSVTNRGGQAVTLSYVNGRIGAVSDDFGRTMTFEYDGEGKLWKVYDPANPQGDANSKPLTFGYDSLRNLATVTRQDNTVRTYHYESAGFPSALTGITNELGTRFATWAYDDQGRAVSSSHADNAESVSIQYGAGNSATITDALGKARSYSTQAVNGVMRTTGISAACTSGCGGAVASTQYDVDGFPDFTIDFRGIKTDYNYDGVRGLEVGRDEAVGTAVARKFQTVWHPTFRLPTCLVEPSRTVHLEYTSNGLLSARTEYDTDDAGKFPDLASKQCAAIATRGDRTSLNQRRVSYTYYPDFSPLKGLLETVDGPLSGIGDRLTYAYNSSTGNLTSITNGLGHKFEFLRYNAHGQVLISKDENGIYTENTYDARGRLRSSKRGPGSYAAGAADVTFTKFELSTMTYDNAGNPDVVTGANGAFIDYDYDAANRLSDIRDNLGNHIHYGLDGLGNRTLIEVRDPNGALARVQSHRYNADNRLELSEGAPRGAETILTRFIRYDGNGNLEEQQDAAGNPTIYSYDALNRLSTVQDAVNGAANPTRYGYNDQGYLRTVTDALGNTTTYSTDGLGNTREIVSPDTGTTRMPEYDAAGNVTTKIDARNKTTRYQYDGVGRLDLITYNDNSTADYVWDQGPNAVGRLSSIIDAVGRTDFNYDEYGRTTGKEHVLDGKTFGVRYGFNANGELETITYPSGKVVRYVYTGGLVTEVRVEGGDTLMSNISHEPFGPVLRWQWGNPAVTVNRTRNNDGLVVRYTLPDTSASLTYYNTGNIKDITNAVNVGEVQALTYDPLYRLDTYSGPGNVSHDYNLDGNGNRTTVTQNGTTSSYALQPNSNQLGSISGGTTRTYNYDAAGNTTSDGTRNFGYDDRGRFVTFNNGQFEYSLNTLGQRVAKTAPAAGDANADGVITNADANLVVQVIGQQAVAPGNPDCTNDARIDVLDITCINNRIRSGNTNAPAQKRYFAYDEAGHLLGEYDANGVAIQETIWLGDLPVATLSNNETHLIYADHLNTPRAITRLDGTVVWRWASEPFGTQRPDEDVDGDDVLFVYNLRFPGQYYDQESQLHYNYFRSYDPSTGRYVEADPIGLAGSLNVYTYANANSIDSSDPLGLWSPDAHDSLIEYAFAGLLSPSDIEILKASGRIFDKNTQSTSMSFAHSMRTTQQAPEEAVALRDNFILDTLAQCQDVASREKALEFLGEALHPIMDSYSPEHVDDAGNPRVWNLREALKMRHSPTEFIGNETVKDITPEIYRKVQIELIKAYNEAFPIQQGSYAD